MMQAGNGSRASGPWERMDRRLTIEGVLEARSGLRVGQGVEPFEPVGSDLPVLRLGERPIVPGSSLRGVLRAYLERVVRAAEPLPAAEASPRQPYSGRGACNPLDLASMCITHDDLEKQFTGQAPEARAAALSRWIWEQSCRVCRLFGSPWLASRVRIADLLPRDGEWGIQIRDGVAIDRDKETVAGGGKYDFEAVTPHSRFDLKIVVDNPTEEEMGMVLFALRELDRGWIQVGGFKGRGLGWVRIHEPKVRLLEFQSPEQVRRYVAGQLEDLERELGESEQGRYIQRFAESLGQG